MRLLFMVVTGAMVFCVWDALASDASKPIVLRPIPLKSANAIVCQNRLRIKKETVDPAIEKVREAREQFDALRAIDTDEKRLKLLEDRIEAKKLGLNLTEKPRKTREEKLAYVKQRLKAEIGRQQAEIDKNKKILRDTLKEECLTWLESLGLGEARGEAFFGGVTLPGSSWDAAVASGLAQFLAERANDEITFWFAQELSTQVCADDQLKSYLPRTCKIGFSERYATGLGALLASSLRQDLEDLPFTLLGKIVELKDNDVRALESLGAVVRSMRNGASAPSALAGLAHSPELESLCKDKPKSAVACWLGEVGLISEYSSDLATASNEAEAEEKIRTLALDTLVEACRGQTKGQSSQDGFCAALNGRLETSCKADRSSAPCQDLTAAFVTIRRAFFQIVADVRRWRESPPTDAAAVLARAGGVLSAVESLLDASVSLLDSDQKLRLGWNKAHPFFSAAAELLKGNYADGIRDALAQLDNLGTLPGATVRYIPVLVDLSQAKDAATVKSLLQTAAAPVGSWRLKSQPKPSIHIAVTGIVGAAGGGEAPLTKGYSGGAAGGLIGAVGFDFAGPVCTDSRWTIGAFLSLLDVGQLISAPAFPATDGQQKQPTAGGSFSIVQILSPGLYFRLGAGNSPFVFGAGVAVAPNLRKYDRLATDGSVLSSQQLTVLRAQAFLGVDLTLFPLN